MKKKAAKVGIVLCVMGAGCYWVWTAIHYVDADAAISRFEAEPSQATADALIRLLDRRLVTQEDGELILKLFMWPEVTTRSSYRLGETPIVSIEHPLVDSPFERSVLMWHEVLRRGELRVHHTNVLWNSTTGPDLNESPRLFRFVGPTPESVGTYKMEIEYECSTVGSSYWKYLIDRIMGRGLGLTDRTFYTCSFSVPVEIVVAEKEEAEQTGYVSNTELDEAMAAAFTSEPLGTSRKFRIKLTRGRATGGARISYANIPADMAFRRVLEFSDGRKIAGKQGYHDPIRGRAGGSGSFEVDPRDFLVEEAGEYAGALVLIADPNVGYGDPAIKSIWRGELKFPVSFRIEINE